MSNKTIGILMPGDMGHGCGKIFLENNFRVVTCLNNRSNRTKKLSNNAGIENVQTIENVVNLSDIILSILPPEAALKQASIVNKIILEKKKYLTYVDCNAVSPKTAEKIYSYTPPRNSRPTRSDDPSSTRIVCTPSSGASASASTPRTFYKTAVSFRCSTSSPPTPPPRDPPAPASTPSARLPAPSARTQSTTTAA